MNHREPTDGEATPSGKNTARLQSGYWVRQLQEAPALLDLPFDAPRRDPQGQPCAGAPLQLCDQLLTDLRALSDEQGTSLPTLLLAGWLVLLARLGGQADLVLCTTAPTLRRLRGLGDTSNSPEVLAIRMNLEHDPSAAEFLAQLARSVDEACSHDPVSVTDVLRLLRLDGDSTGAPALQVGCEYAESDGPPVLSGLDLCLFLHGAEGALRGELRYPPSILHDATAARWLGHYRCLLRAIADDPGRRISQLPLLGAEQRSQLLQEFNATATDYPPGQTVHGLFEAQAARTPEAVAVVYGSGEVTYAQLNQRANQLAHRLRTMGLKPDSRVAICAERSIGMVVGLLAILKAGGAYVPLDPDYPPERLQAMLADCDPVAVLTQAALQESLAAWLPSGHPPVLLLDDGSAQDPACTGNPGAEGLEARHLAYVIYTSGSTGTPKGAMNQHDGVVNRLLWAQSQFRLSEQDRVLQKTSFAFDVSVWEFFLPLLAGARLVMARPGGQHDPAYLAELIDSAGITMVHFVPSMLQVFADQGQLARCTGLHHLVCSGEALPLALQRQCLAALPTAALHNLYGPTEAAVDVTYWQCSTSDSCVPIGRPIANTQIHILDRHGEPVPIGVAGELHIGGVQVARGYLNRPALSAERFVADPFSAVPGARLYRTGDLARWRADGVIEYLGRNDFQVKIRGFRIELGEIEACLRKQPRVREAVVLAREDSPGDMRLVAYVVPESAARSQDWPGLQTQLRQSLAEALPGFMMPAAFVAMAKLPLTVNGKLDRRALPAPDRERPVLAMPYEPPRGDAEHAVCDSFASVLGLDRAGREDNFFELGGNSLLALRLLENLRKFSQRQLSATLVFANPTPASLARALAGVDDSRLGPERFPEQHRPVAPAQAGKAPGADAVAIIAMAGRFPGANSIEQLWENLCEGRDSITYFNRDELDPSIAPSEMLDPAYVAARGIIDGVEYFDAAFFGINPREAELMDPQQRIFLELCWECMERGGYQPDGSRSPVGVFAGTWDSTYLRRHVLAHPELVERVGTFPVVVANEKDYIATRVANKLNLTGPAISLHTACSTSLVAICQAFDSLRAGHCDMALAGGIAITCPPRSGYLFQEGSMLSPDGHTRTFDAQAQGTTFSDGAAVVLLKRLADAIRDGDQVHGVILGCAVNNDGGGKASFTAPSADGQAAVIAMAQANAGVSARSISYVEAHGTGTPLGDPIEIEGLTRAFRRQTADVGFCRIGSAKSNVGHLVIAAGATGVIKTTMSLTHRCLPQVAHFQTPNPAIDFASSPFTVSNSLSVWSDEHGPLRAGVSSFGVGGTNAHIILEQAPVLAESDAAPGPHLLVLSARSPEALARATELLADSLQAGPAGAPSRPPSQALPAPALADVAWTLAAGRKPFPYRLALACADHQDAVAQLRATGLAQRVQRTLQADAIAPVFTFPGQGSQYAGMGTTLRDSEPAFAAAFDECCDWLRQRSGLDLHPLLKRGEAADLLPTAVMQPAIFCVEYAMARLWMSRSVAPAAMIGHSLGELVAATIAGVFSLPDALWLVANRGALMQAQPAGAMLSVRLPLAALEACLPDGLCVAAENAPGSCVVSGARDAIAAFSRQLESAGIACRKLPTSHAFHSAMMEPVVAPFRELVASVPRSAPVIRMVSTATGDWLDAATAASPDYWSHHLRAPVRFGAALSRVLDGGPGQVLLEVGPGSALSGLARQHPEVQKSQAACIASLADNHIGERRAFLSAAGQLWCRGVSIDPAGFDTRQRRRRVQLPTYPFERKRFWVDALPSGTGASALPGESIITSVASRLMPQGHVRIDSVDCEPVERPAGAGPLAHIVEPLVELFDAVRGATVVTAELDANFMQLGLDSLSLTQVSLQLQKQFKVKVSFRELMGEASSVNRLAALIATRQSLQQRAAM